MIVFLLNVICCPLRFAQNCRDLILRHYMLLLHKWRNFEVSIDQSSKRPHGKVPVYRSRAIAHSPRIRLRGRIIVATIVWVWTCHSRWGRRRRRACQSGWGGRDHAALQPLAESGSGTLCSCTESYPLRSGIKITSQTSEKARLTIDLFKSSLWGKIRVFEFDGNFYKLCIRT